MAFAVQDINPPGFLTSEGRQDLQIMVSVPELPLKSVNGKDIQTPVNVRDAFIPLSGA